MPILRVYADTSVFGGPFDDRFSEASNSFFEQVRWGRFQLVTSAVVRDEIAPAPQEVQSLFNDLFPSMEIVDLSREALELREAYVDAEIVAPRWAVDALHVALATIAKCSLLVSWNFQHIVHFHKIPLYNAINMLNGYPPIAIHSPMEVIDYEAEET
jgi:hypothetical protein